jgi:hypothetical protein
MRTAARLLLATTCLTLVACGASDDARQTATQPRAVAADPPSGCPDVPCEVKPAGPPSGQVVKGPTRLVRAPIVAVGQAPGEAHVPHFVAYVRLNRPVRKMDTFMNDVQFVSMPPVGYDAFTDLRRCLQIGLTMRPLEMPESFKHLKAGDRVRLRLAIESPHRGTIATTVRLQPVVQQEPLEGWFDALGCPDRFGSYTTS